MHKSIISLYWFFVQHYLIRKKRKVASFQITRKIIFLLLFSLEMSLLYPEVFSLCCKSTIKPEPSQCFTIRSAVPSCYTHVHVQEIIFRLELIYFWIGSETPANHVFLSPVVEFMFQI